MTSSRRHTDVTVEINGSSVPELNVIAVHRVINGNRVNQATLQVETMFRDYSYHQDKEFAKIASPFVNYGDVVKVIRKTKQGSTRVIHRGIITSISGKMSPGGEVTLLESRFDPYLMSQEGNPVVSAKFVQYTNFTWELSESVDLDVVLNPIKDGRCVPNMMDQYTPLAPIWIDAVPADWYNTPDFEDTVPEIEFWTVPRVIEWLCDNYNDETYVTNPKRADLDLIFDQDDSIVRDFRIRRGSFIPEYFDRLLEPLGYAWAYLFDDQSGKTTLDFWKRNSAYRNRDLDLQRFGETVNVDSEAGVPFSEVESYNITQDPYNRAAPEILIAGGFRRFESTFELVPAWDPRYDNLNLDIVQLLNDSPEMLADPALRRVYRDWVLNEAGEYSHFGQAVERAGGPYANGLNNAYDFSNIAGWGNWVKMRRKFLSSITVDPEAGGSSGVHRGIKIEIYLPSEYDWIDPAKAGYPINVQILKNECGITLGDSQLPPIDAWTQFRPLGVSSETFRVRVTATVESDERVTYIASGPSLTTIPIQQVVDVGNKYAYAVVDDSSIYHGAANYFQRELNSLLVLEDIGDEILDSWNTATTSGKIVLDGLDTDLYLLGRQISSIQPRNIRLQANVTTEQDLNPIYPTVVGITYDVQAQKTTLDLDVYRQNLRRY